MFDAGAAGRHPLHGISYRLEAAHRDFQSDMRGGDEGGRLGRPLANV